MLNATIVIAIGGIVAVIAALLIYITRLDLISKSHFTGNLSNGLLVGLIFAIFAYSLFREKEFAAKSTTIFNSFVEGAYNGLAVGRIIFPYILGMPTNLYGPNDNFDLESKRVFYLDPKLYAAGSRDSSFRTFYFEPKKSTNKVRDDAVHFVVGFEHAARETG